MSEVRPGFLDRSLRWIPGRQEEAPRWPGRDGGSRAVSSRRRGARGAHRERDSVQAIATRHELHPNQVSTWKRQPARGAAAMCLPGATGRKLAKEHEAKIRDLHAKIGELTVERDFFRRGLRALSTSARSCADDRAGPDRHQSLSRQCALLGNEPVVAVLPARPGGARGEPGAHAAPGRTRGHIGELSVLRQPAA